MNKNYIETLVKILEDYHEDYETAIDTVIDSCVSVIKVFKKASMDHTIIECEIDKMHDMLRHLARDYEAKSNRVGVVALDIGFKIDEHYFVNMYEYARKTLVIEQEKELKDVDIDIRIDEF